MGRMRPTVQVRDAGIEDSRLYSESFGWKNNVNEMAVRSGRVWDMGFKILTVASFHH